MTKSPRHWLVFAIAVLLLLMSVRFAAQEVTELPLTEELTTVDDVEVIRTPPVPAVTNSPSSIQRQPMTQDELEAMYGPEALAIMNEQLRHEIQLLAREYRESERRNEIQLFGLGAIVALIFLGIGFLIGKRFGGRRLL